ncbi:endospore germination permease [Paenibacillus thalictri]|uniref:Spore gernimation protein n=1 Tax=Paenibacillus thalictri TaxID=2527873 RepID=A0A4V2J387_9BACL|nr:endospore germination permease [Paenibacillus thalictri]TBL70504.1 spore gernimation protein [Paenibacillus thalictri]
MIHSNEKISFLQACMIFALMNGLTSHVVINAVLLDASGRDAWITVLATGVIYIPWCVLLVYIMRKMNYQRLQFWMAEHSSPLVSWLLIAPLCLQLYSIGGLTVIHTTVWTITNYLPATPKLALILPIVLFCWYCASAGIRTIAVSAGMLLPLVIMLGIFVSVANASEKDFYLLKPFLEDGWKPVMNGMIFAGGSLLELSLILVMQHRIKSEVKVWQIVLFGLFIVGITLGPILGGITEFGPKEAAKQMTSPYEQWRLVKIGDYVEHVDFFSVYQWLAGATIRISAAIFLMADILPFRTDKWRKRFMFLVMLSYIVLPMLPISQNAYYLWMYHVHIPVFLAVSLALTVIWTVMSLYTKPVKERAT